MREGYLQVDSLDVLSDFSELSRVETFVDEFCSSNQVDEVLYGNVLIAVTEAVNNAIFHGNQQNSSKHVKLLVGTGNDSFCFSIKDEGDGFDFNHLPDPTSPENILKENGRGVFLMKALSDDLEFDDNGSKVTIYFTKA